MVDTRQPGTRSTGPFARWAEWVAGHARSVLVVGVLALLALATGVPRIEFETHAERFLSERHPSRQRYEAFKRDFGLDTAIFVLIETADVFHRDFLARLAAFHERLESELPHVDEVESLASARLLESDGGLLRVGEVRDAMPLDAEQSRRLFERLRATSTYPDHVFSSDRRVTAVAIRLTPFDATTAEAHPYGADAPSPPAPPLSAIESGRVVARVRALAEQAWPDRAWHLAGNPVVNERLAAAFARDMLLFTAIAVATIAICLALLFRRASAVGLPLAIVLLSILGTLGAAGWTGVTLNVAIQILPAFLLAIGASAAIHLLVLTYRRIDAGESRREAVAAALAQAGPALVATSATTAAGLGSFAVASDLSAVALLGRIAPIGVAITFFAVVALLPAALVALPIRPARHDREPPGLRLGAGLARLGVATLRARRLVLGLAALVFALALLAMRQIEAANDALAYFPPEDPLRVATRLFDERLSGSISLEVLVEAGSADGVQSPVLVAALDALSRDLAGLSDLEGARISRTLSLVDILREIHAAVAMPGPGEPTLPMERPLIAQELLLFESSGADDLARVVAADYSSARVTLRAPWVPSQHYLALMPRVEALLRETLPPGFEVSTTGLIVLFAEAVEAISQGFRTSYATALLLITVMMACFLRSLRGGLLSMVPNVLPIAITLGLMGAVGIHLDLFTMLIGSIAIGLAVDDTVHLGHAFRRGWDVHGDLERAVREGLETTGSAIVTSSIVLCLGFSGFVFSPMTNLVDFGLLTSLSIALALVTDVLLLPSIFAITVAREARRR